MNNGADVTVKNDVRELIFPTRPEFRAWLSENAVTNEGVWLVFGKTKTLVTLTANDALEEALCFGWIDGVMKSVDGTRYVKYFARRRAKSVWSDKNKKTVERLREKGIMTALGEKAVADAVQNGAWEAQKREPVTNEQIDALTEKLRCISPAYENFMKMPPSVKRTYTLAYFSPKSEEARQRGFLRIVDRLNKNLKPM
jgi:uncharacterized protein YdeI (YjbR/CyaY-like superfamily)